MIFFDPASFEIVRVVFDEPQWAPAPGQSAVFYDNDVVIGGGIISPKRALHVRHMCSKSS